MEKSCLTTRDVTLKRYPLKWRPKYQIQMTNFVHLVAQSFKPKSIFMDSSLIKMFGRFGYEKNPKSKATYTPALQIDIIDRIWKDTELEQSL